MQLVKRSAIAFSIAAFVPLLLVGSFYIASMLHQRNREAEDKTVGRAVNYLGQVDRKLSADLGALSVLVTSQAFGSGAWQEARDYAVTVANGHPHWKNVALVNAASGQPIWQTVSLPDSVALAPSEVPGLAKPGEAHEVGDFPGAKRECKCIPLQRRFTVNGLPYILVLEREIVDIQESLMAAVLPGEIAALVDRKAIFIARTIDHETRLGTPATQYVRDAVRQGGNGVYSGITYEGLRNRTAYATSELSGWSAHIAVPAANYNLLSAGYISFGLLAIVSAFGFAGAVLWYAIRDLSSRRLAEQVRMRSQKLEAVGYLSGTVAHDFNNLLAVMTACLRLLDRPREGVIKEKIIQEGLAAADRGEKLVRRLLAFARDKPLELDCVDLESTLAGIQDLLVRSLGPGIAMTVSLAPEARHVRTNGSQLELVLINLAVNARDAMPDGGTFSITSERASAKGYVDLLVKDTGTGMPKEIAARVLEPFFTTKAEGKGTGLGLAQAHLLVKESGGSLQLETAPGMGAVFILHLPVCKPRSVVAAS